MAEHETIADLIAWLRRPREGENAYLTLWRDEIADRLEAAHKRELSKNVSKNGADFGQLGDAAKLREACANAAESAAEIMERVRHKDGLAFNTANYIVGVAKDALSAPPRNCDRYSHDEALNIWAAEKENERNGCFDEWLYHVATEQKGEPDEQK